MQRLLFRLLGSTYRSETYESVQTTWVRSDRSDLQSEIGRIPIPWRSSSKGERDARQETGDRPRAMEEAFLIQSEPKRSVLGGLVNSLAVGYGLNEIAEDIP